MYVYIIVFVISGTKFLNPLECFVFKSYEGVFGYINKVTFGKPFEAILGLDWVPGNQPYD